MGGLGPSQLPTAQTNWGDGGYHAYVKHSPAAFSKGTGDAYLLHPLKPPLPSAFPLSQTAAYVPQSLKDYFKLSIPGNGQLIAFFKGRESKGIKSVIIQPFPREGKGHGSTILLDKLVGVHSFDLSSAALVPSSHQPVAEVGCLGHKYTPQTKWQELCSSLAPHVSPPLHLILPLQLPQEPPRCSFYTHRDRTGSQNKINK